MSKKLLVMTSAFTLGCLCCGRSWDYSLDDSPQVDSPCPSEECPSHEGIDGLQLVLKAAEQHGKESEPDHEVGDLQDALHVVWDLLTPGQKSQFLANDTVRDLLMNELGMDLHDAAKVPEDVFIVVQEGGSSGELYVHGLASEEDANAYRHSASDSGSYRTSPIVKVDGRLASDPVFFSVVASILDASVELDYPASA